MQALNKNWSVLLVLEAALATWKMVNNVFNFGLMCLSETLDETHSVGFLVFPFVMQN
jgi:hypothetical protein